MFSHLLKFVTGLLLTAAFALVSAGQAEAQSGSVSTATVSNRTGQVVTVYYAAAGQTWQSMNLSPGQSTSLSVTTGSTLYVGFYPKSGAQFVQYALATKDINDGLHRQPSYSFYDNGGGFLVLQSDF
jgi:hypothetical protein